MREPEQQVAREAVSRILNGQPRSDVVAWLKAEGHRGTMGGDWTNGSLGRFLANPAIAGLERDPKTGELHETGRPALITPEEFKQLDAQAGRTNGVAPARDADFPYLLSEGVAECGQCAAHSMTGGRTNAGTPSYRCQQCGLRITAAALEDYVGENVLAELSRPATRKALEAAQHELQNEADSLRQQIETLTGQRKQLAEPYAEGQVTRDTLVAADRAVSEKLRSARTRLRFVEQVANVPIGGVEDLVRWWEHAPHASKRALVVLLLDGVQVMPARARGVRSADGRVALRWRTARAA
ncbi:recombinase family protein [Streptomyces hydrogenans]|uniref:recombinase family protein n=1 Tax=Streptomyces hydrogenans TaxID=1873719 RepID=UPI0035E2D97C